MISLLPLILLCSIVCRNITISLKSIERLYHIHFLDKEREYIICVQTYRIRLRNHILLTNLEYINAVNCRNLTYSLGITPFIYMSTEEFIGSRLIRGFTYDRKVESSKQSSTHVNNSIVPNTVDWRKKGIMSEVMNQGSCGSCYAMTAVEVVSAVNRIAGRFTPDLSPQEVVDCSGSYGNSGCNGGSILSGLMYARDKGIYRASVYPYTAKEGTCRSTSNPKMAIKAAEIVNEITESSLQELVSRHPVGVAIVSSWAPMQHYRSGVLTGKCSGLSDHAMVVAGYGSIYCENNERVDFWLLKNSWGRDWGESGYVRLQRNTGGMGMCNIGLSVAHASLYYFLFITNKS